MIAHDSASRPHGPECGTSQLQSTEEFRIALGRTVETSPFDPDELRHAATACGHEAKLRGIRIERLIAELGDCLRLYPVSQKQYADLRQRVVGWVLSVYFPPA